jgi:tetratricopeptide (TPR) repeat protein
MRDDMNLYPVCLLPDPSENHHRNDEGPNTELPVLPEARGLLYQGKVDQALSRLETLFLPSGLWTGPKTSGNGTHRREAALLKAWCLIGLKQHAEAERWLETACCNGHLPLDDPGARVIILNKMLCEEKYKEVQLAAEDLLAKVTDPADRNHAELRLVLGAALRWQGKLDEAVGHVEFACSAFTVMDVPGRAAVAANFLGWIQLSRGRLDESRRWFEKSLDINTALEARLRMAQNFQNLAIVCYKQGDYGPSLWRKNTDWLGNRSWLSSFSVTSSGTRAGSARRVPITIAPWPWRDPWPPGGTSWANCCGARANVWTTKAVTRKPTLS